MWALPGINVTLFRHKYRHKFVLLYSWKNSTYQMKMRELARWALESFYYVIIWALAAPVKPYSQTKNAKFSLPGESPRTGNVMRGIQAFLATSSCKGRNRGTHCFLAACHVSTPHVLKLPLPYMTRSMSWISRQKSTSRASRDPHNDISEAEEAVRQAILDKVLRAGRQPPSELMLRCMFFKAFIHLPSIILNMNLILIQVPF